MTNSNEELHLLLRSLKDLSPVKLEDTKKKIRTELISYRITEPFPPWFANIEPSNNTPKNVVFYSFLDNPEKPAIANHEYKRLEISWRSLRKYNTDIEIRFCYSGSTTQSKNKWQALCEDYNVSMYPFHESFTGNEPNAWSIHRWYNLSLWADEDLNILYLDADTYINDDVQILFDTYRRDAVYGREELGFRYDPNLGVSGKDPRFFLDLVDASMVSQGSRVDVHKYCLGVILLNHSVHKILSSKENLIFYTNLLKGVQDSSVFYPIPNYRIMDEFALWVLLGKNRLRTSLFGDQDVSHTFMEKKHEQHFNPVVLHYTTKDEEKFADWSPEFFCLSRTEEAREESDMSVDMTYNITSMIREELNIGLL
jgi:hypothetical protein